jgi:predicted permease
MQWLRKLSLLLPWVRHQREKSLDEELQSYLEMAAAEARSRGLSPKNAQFAARRDLGNMLRAKEQVRGEWLSPRVDQCIQDLRYATRTLARTPLFTSVAVLSLALGIGCATAVFSLVEGVLLKPLPYQDSGRLVAIREVVPAMSRAYPSLPVNIEHFIYWRDHTHAFQSMAALRSDRATLTGGGEPVQIDSIETTADLFRVLAVNTAQGRGFLPGEDQPGRNNVAVITDSLWRRRFHAASNLIGQSITLDGDPATVVGILRPDFTFPKGDDLGVLSSLGKRTEIFRPLQEITTGWDGDYDYLVIGRLNPNVGLPQGLAELNGLTKQLITANKVESEPYPLCVPLLEVISGSVRTSLTVLLAAVLALLLIVCVNLANLMLARSSVRAREFSIRTALGASRRRLLQQVLTETGVLSLAGGTLGAVLSAAAIRLFPAAAGAAIPRLNEVHLDGGVLLFSLFTTVACAAVFGLIPAFQVSRSFPQEALRAGAHNVTASRQSLRLRTILVAFEVTLSTTLLFLAGLLMSSLFRLMNVDKGFTEEQAITVDLGLPGARYGNAAERTRFFDRVLAGVRTVPGIRSAGMISGLPLTGDSMVNGVELEGSGSDWIDASNKNVLLINVRFISPDYFETLGIPIMQGRSVSQHDRDRRVTVISARLAAKIWPNQNPIGKKFKTGSQVGLVEVVGVVRDTYTSRLDESPTLIAYVPYWVRGPSYGSLVMRTAVDPNQLMEAVRRTIWSIDPELPVAPLRTMSDLVTDALARRRFQMRLAASFGAGALLLALIGIYGVVAYNAAHRRTELGLRLALGAKRSGLMGLMLRRGLEPVLAGLACGLALSAACGWFVRSLLFGVTATDPLTMAVVAVLLSVTALLACLMPAYSAAKMDPASILRHE